MPRQTDPGLPASRRDVLRALGAGALGLPLAACGTSAPVERPVTRLVSPRTPLPPVAPAPDTLAAAADSVAADSTVAEAVVPAARSLVLPRRIRPAGTIGLVAPAGVIRSVGQVEEAVADVRAMGFEARVGRHALARYGFLAGTDQERADDFMDMVTDPDVDAVVCLRGGYGAARILPLLDYDAIRVAAKPIVGYSDVTALLLAVYAKAGVVTFHGPVGISQWAGTTADAFRRVLVRGERLAVQGETNERRTVAETVRQGRAEGPLAGGNLSVVASLAGTGYLPDFDGHVAFFEEVGEESYRLDRLFTQLELAGVLRNPAAVVFGQCSDCSSGGSAWTAEEVLRDHLGSYRCPAWIGAPIGHVSPVYTLPIGLRVATDADAGTLEAVGPAVS
ncbi:MAG TPA: LD-carboxypeptidase [Rubricoccaceae bacterium]|jgi:muramoyltetrapeptide carboxypeptidase